MEDEGEHGNNPLSMWELIPWDFVSKTSKANAKKNAHPMVDPNISASLRAHNRGVAEEIQASNWKNVSKKLFTV